MKGTFKEKYLKYDLDEYSIKQVKELIGYKEKPTKSIEKWSFGSYIVPLQDKLLTRTESLIKGKPYQIIKYTTLPYIISERGEEINFIDDDNTEKKEGIKWFATKAEAEEFAKTLLEPVNEEAKQSLKQAVHCKTQEEWDFVKNKINRTNTWDEDYPCQILVGTTNWKGEVQFCIDEGIQILSFQEWCDLNNYIMNKKKYTIKEVETNRKLIIYIDSKEEHDKIQKVSKRVCIYCGNYCYSLYEGRYSTLSSKSYPGAFDKDSIILTIDDINFEDNIENGDKEAPDKIKLTYLPEPD